MENLPVTPQPVGDPKVAHYLTYPHHNGFTPDGGVVLGRLENDAVCLCRIDPGTGTSVELGRFPLTENLEYIWFDVARDTGRVAAATPEELWVFDGLADGPGSGKRVTKLEGVPAKGLLPAISADGGRVLLEHRHDGRYGYLCVHVDDGRAERHLDKDWLANHFHFCPHDESWVGFSHEGRTESVTDRVWGHHPEKAPEGVCLFDQSGSGLCIGHERWCFHRTTAIGVAYGDSPRGPRGIYEFFPDDRAPKLISEADRDWHVNISPDGRWAVVDTTGPHDKPGKGWQDTDHISHIVLIDTATGERLFLAESRLGAAHPFHPHPAFSPDGAWIYFNRPEPDGRHRVLRVPNPRQSGAASA